ncbi:TadE/TadG family type IV pilus assembly protein [Raineyella sp. LH-20]|uniref:TadE/TadG family type IV pilus assembly protein n=1 Tax=Raineyella sp. LH-20 TaxID=3081204 RepID=UPI002955916D|nr:TadE/TadG family type IV pilus assembly protein [Raineyella sp. LH-20]WOP20194.1 TadE/TadG family type IV pilus assembly protein [Raineyella sp. LH-20]
MLWPLVMLLVLGTVQLGVWWHARLTLGAAAATAADLLSVEGTSPTSAEAAAQRVAAAGGVESVTVSASRGPRQVDVVVRGTAPLVIDLGLSRLEVSAAAPREVAR